jgi:hypothetical protein
MAILCASTVAVKRIPPSWTAQTTSSEGMSISSV